jgi:N-acetylneuraminic acid mutarotase
MKKFINILLIAFCSMLVYPVQAQWIEKSHMPLPLSGISAVGFGGKIYVIGGKNLNVFHSRVDVYDPETDDWDTTSVPDLVTARSNAACVVYDGRIYIIGGRNGKGSLRNVEFYDPDSNAWYEADAIKGPRDGALAEVMHDTMYVIGGVSNDGGYVEKIEYYDKSDDFWKNAGVNISPSRAGGLSAMRGDTLWLFGGYYFSPLSGSLKFTSDKTWITGPDLSVARGEGAAVIEGDSILLIGGESAEGAVPLVEIYNIRTGLIEAGIDLPEARAGHATVSYAGRVYVFGGHGGNQANIYNSVLCFDPTTTGIKAGIKPDSYQLLEAYPNPFNNSTRIKFVVSGMSEIRLSIVDIGGRKVSTLINGTYQPGTYYCSWNGTSDFQNTVATGIYFLIMQTDRRMLTRKLIYLR